RCCREGNCNDVDYLMLNDTSYALGHLKNAITCFESSSTSRKSYLLKLVPRIQLTRRKVQDVISFAEALRSRIAQG
ncbi:MAG: hypothetical protein LBJ89_00460, partial [Holosporales bacterium]|nr:hypothetical protein [Holosporales bacterium]